MIAAAFAACQYVFFVDRGTDAACVLVDPSGFVGFLNHDFKAKGIGKAFCRGHMKRPEPRQAEIFPTSLVSLRVGSVGIKTSVSVWGSSWSFRAAFVSRLRFSTPCIRCCDVICLLSQQTIAGAVATIKT